MSVAAISTDAAACGDLRDAGGSVHFTLALLGIVFSSFGITNEFEQLFPCVLVHLAMSAIKLGFIFP